MGFDVINLKRPILNAIEDMGFKEPTPIQVAAFSKVLSGRDIVGIAQTGTGKSLAYLLPILNSLPFSDQKYPRVLIVVPTRELVLQVERTLNELSAYMSCRVGAVYGGTNINTQKAIVNEGLDILVATPGRMVDLALTGILRLKNIQRLVIDEVDEMLNLGFLPQLENILDLLSEKRQNLLFSATMTDEVSVLIDKFFKDPIRVEVNQSGTPLKEINQAAYILPNTKTKLNLLELLLKDETEFTKVLVFTGNKKIANEVYDRLDSWIDGRAAVMHSNKTQNARNLALASLEDGTLRVIVATDVVARGVDVDGISHVFNFDIPENPESYIHRIGRTGRAGAYGKAIAFIQETEFERMEAIESLMEYQLPIQELPEGLEIIEGADPVYERAAFDIDYLPKIDSLTNSQGAFQEKIQKNSKVNLGGLNLKKERKKEEKKRKKKNKK